MQTWHDISWSQTFAHNPELNQLIILLAPLLIYWFLSESQSHKEDEDAEDVDEENDDDYDEDKSESSKVQQSDQSNDTAG